LVLEEPRQFRERMSSQELSEFELQALTLEPDARDSKETEGVTEGGGGGGGAGGGEGVEGEVERKKGNEEEPKTVVDETTTEMSLKGHEREESEGRDPHGYQREQSDQRDPLQAQQPQQQRRHRRKRSEGGHHSRKASRSSVTSMGSQGSSGDLPGEKLATKKKASAAAAAGGGGGAVRRSKSGGVRAEGDSTAEALAIELTPVDTATSRVEVAEKEEEGEKDRRGESTPRPSDAAPLAKAALDPVAGADSSKDGNRKGPKPTTGLTKLKWKNLTGEGKPNGKIASLLPIRSSFVIERADISSLVCGTMSAV